MRRLAVGLLVLALAAACGGGGGGGGGPTAPPPPVTQPQIVFTPQGAAGANSVSLASGAATTANTLFLEVRASQVTDLYGVAFDLSYPAAQLQFVQASPGPMLGASGSVQAASGGAGSLIVGGTHLGNVPGSNGSGVVMILQFNAIAAGQGTFQFSRNSVLDSDGAIQGGVSWVAGSVQVTR
ncbi:MAG TPA: cohesin domain-containing protein [Thermoanaerobaculia bacterium]